jgi:hypothetical protein
MHASVGDRIMVRRAHGDAAARDGEVVEVRGADGSPPYLVQWSDIGHAGLYFPSSDAVIHHHDPVHIPVT